MAKAHKAGALDIRNVIGALLFVYGVILTIMGLVGDKELQKTGDINANLIAGICLLVVGAAFGLWARLKPIIVPADFAAEHEQQGPAGHGPAH